MKLPRIGKILLAAVVIIMCGYTSLWFLQAYRIEASIRKAVERINNAGGDLRLSVGQVDVSGFPLSYEVAIGNAQAFLLVPGKNARYQISHMEPLLLKTSFLGNRLSFQLPARLDVIRYKGDSITGSFAAIYKQRPELTLRLANDFDNILFVKGFPDPSSVMQRFREFSYQDKGMSLVDSKIGDAAASYAHYHFVVTQTPGENSRSVFRFRTQGSKITLNQEEWLKGMEPYMQDMVQDIVQTSEKTGAYDFNMEFSLTGQFPPKRRSDLEFDLDVKQAAYVNARYAWNSDGKITASKEDILPYGWFRVSIKNYNNFLEQAFAVANMAIRLAKGGDPLKYPNLQEITEPDKKALLDTLKAVGTFSNGNEDISVIVAREKGGEIYIGQLPIEEAMVFIQGGV